MMHMGVSWGVMWGACLQWPGFWFLRENPDRDCKGLLTRWSSLMRTFLKLQGTPLSKDKKMAAGAVVSIRIRRVDRYQAHNQGRRGATQWKPILYLRLQRKDNTQARSADRRCECKSRVQSRMDCDLFGPERACMQNHTQDLKYYRSCMCSILTESNGCPMINLIIMIMIITIVIIDRSIS